MRQMRIFIWIALLFATTAVHADLVRDLSTNDFALSQVPAYTRTLASDIARLFADEECAERLREELNSGKAAHDLLPLLQKLRDCSAARQVHTAATLLDEKIRVKKSIAERVAHLLQIRLVLPLQRLNNKGEILVASIPAGDEKAWKAIEAFDCHGNLHLLPVEEQPEQQVLVVEINAKRDMRAGLALMNEELCKAGLQTEVRLEAGLSISRLDYIRLRDDKEPWIKGDAEIYALVNGFDQENDRPRIVAAEMPYLAKDDEDYQPHQTLVVWNNYRYKAANILFYEHDVSTDYQEIAKNLLKELSNMFPDYQDIFKIADRIISIMPGEWWSDDDDYVDSLYTIEEGRTYENYPGAARNAKVTLVPHIIPGK